MPLPLEGIRVVDFSRVLAGPHCAKTLLDLGAEVIKLEPPGGDLSRKAFPSQGQVSGYYAQQNAGKRNVSIDLNVPGAREAALRLCDTADVIVENFRPGALASFGLGYESVSADNPGVVYASISGYGQHGAWRSRMAYAPTVQAETGITANTADHFERTGTFRSDSLSHADVYSGLHAAIAILACLTERARTGRGQYIDVAMAAVMLSINERVHVDLSDAELGAERPILGATDGPFFTGPHGERFASPMSLVGSMSFPFYLAAMRRPDLGRDPRFRTPERRLRNLDGAAPDCSGVDLDLRGHGVTRRSAGRGEDRHRTGAQRRGVRGQRLGTPVERGAGRVRPLRWRDQDSGPPMALRGPGGSRRGPTGGPPGRAQRRGTQRAGILRRRDRGAGSLRCARPADRGADDSGRLAGRRVNLPLPHFGRRSCESARLEGWSGPGRGAECRWLGSDFGYGCGVSGDV
jgi:crotonobetainyl-CoA:carnitine CoA-transferase CaiB-like acyl-CoA transferase